MVEGAGKDGRLLDCSVRSGVAGEAAERPQSHRRLHRPDDLRRGVRRQDVPRVSRLPLLTLTQHQVPGCLGGSWRSRQTTLGQVCRVDHRSNSPPIKLMATGTSKKISTKKVETSLQAELARWNSSYNLRYVVLVEMLLSDGFSLHQRSEDGHGTYGRRTGDDHQVWNIGSEEN